MTEILLMLLYIAIVIITAAIELRQAKNSDEVYDVDDLTVGVILSVFWPITLLAYAWGKIMGGATRYIFNTLDRLLEWINQGKTGVITATLLIKRFANYDHESEKVYTTLCEDEHAIYAKHDDSYILYIKHNDILGEDSLGLLKGLRFKEVLIDIDIYTMPRADRVIRNISNHKKYI